jgi:putative ABC transport system permease protein
VTTLVLALANVRALWRRFVGLVLLITISVALCVSAFLITDRAQAATHDKVAEGTANRSIVVDKLGDRDDTRALTEDGLATIRAVSGVRAVEPVAQASFGYKSAAVPGAVFYATSLRPSQLPPVVVSDRAHLFPLKPGEVVLPERAQGSGLRSLVGTRIDVQVTRSTQRGEGRGVTRHLTVVGLFDPSWQLDGPDAAYVADTTAVSWAALRAGLSVPTYLDTVGYDSATVVTASAADVPPVLDALQREHFAASSLQQQLEALPAVLEFVHVAGYVLLACLVFLTAFSAYQVMTALGRQRMREVGILKAVGFRDARVFRLFALESAVVALVSAVLGLLTATVVATVGNDMLRSRGELRTFLEPGAVVPRLVAVGLVAAGVLVVVACGALLPTLRAARLAPADAIREW